MAHAHARAHRAWEGSLDMPLMWLSPSDPFTVRNACENAIFLGGIGGGKSSSARVLRRAILAAGAGLICLVSKPDEATACLEDARAAGRLSSVIRIDGTHGFNFVRHLLALNGLDGIGSVVECLMTVLEIVRNATAQSGRPSESFWQDALRQLLFMALQLLYSAYGTVDIRDLVRFIRSAPSSIEQMDDEAWRKDSFFAQTVILVHGAPAVPMAKAEYDRIISYWRLEFARFDNKLRMNITSTLSTSLDRFTHGRLAKFFCSETTFTPELTLNGAVLVLDLPVLTLREDGQIAQQIIHYLWQRVILSRNSLAPHLRDRLVCAWIDEAQVFLNSKMRAFLAEARSSRCATVMLTQNIPAIITTVGGDHARDESFALLGQCGTKVFCNNSCPETNRFAAETIGRAIQHRATYSEGESSGFSGGVNLGESWNEGTNSSFGVSIDHQGNRSSSSSFGTSSGSGESAGRSRGYTTGQSVSTGYGEHMDYEIEPAEFSRSLLTGGPGGIVTAVWFQAGRRFDATGRNWLLASFRQ